jgi:hypothetical protein
MDQTKTVSALSNYKSVTQKAKIEIAVGFSTALSHYIPRDHCLASNRNFDRSGRLRNILQTLLEMYWILVLSDGFQFGCMSCLDHTIIQKVDIDLLNPYLAASHSIKMAMLRIYLSTAPTFHSICTVCEFRSTLLLDQCDSVDK